MHGHFFKLTYAIFEKNAWAFFQVNFCNFLEKMHGHFFKLTYVIFEDNAYREPMYESTIRGCDKTHWTHRFVLMDNAYREPMYKSTIKGCDKTHWTRRFVV